MQAHLGAPSWIWLPLASATCMLVWLANYWGRVPRDGPCPTALAWLGVGVVAIFALYHWSSSRLGEMSRLFTGAWPGPVSPTAELPQKVRSALNHRRSMRRRICPSC